MIFKTCEMELIQITDDYLVKEASYGFVNMKFEFLVLKKVYIDILQSYITMKSE